MVFVVIPYVKGNDVEHAIITEGFLFFIMGEVVFLYPSCAKRVKADGEKEAGQQVYDGFRTEGHPDTGCKTDLSQPVQCYPFIKGLDLAETGDAEDLEYRIEKQPDDLADKEVVDEFGFPAVGQVGVEFMNTLERVMLNVISFE